LAHYSHRTINNEDLVVLGEMKEYEPLSRAAYYKSMLRDKVRNMKVNEAEEISSKVKKA
jgi:thymidine kinase